MTEWARNMKIFVFLVNVHQKVTLAGKDFNNQIYRVPHFMELPFVLMNKVTLFVGVEVMQWLGNMDSH